MSDSSSPISAEEMKARFERKEDPFDLTLEKWERLERFLRSAFTLDDYNVFLAGCQVAIPFCQMYAVNEECEDCPLFELCQGIDEDEETLWSGLYRLIQAYGWAGDMLPPEPLKNYVQRFVQVLQETRDKKRSASSSRSSGANPL